MLNRIVIFLILGFQLLNETIYSYSQTEELRMEIFQDSSNTMKIWLKLSNNTKENIPLMNFYSSANYLIISKNRYGFNEIRSINSSSREIGKLSPGEIYLFQTELWPFAKRECEGNHTYELQWKYLDKYYSNVYNIDKCISPTHNNDYFYNIYDLGYKPNKYTVDLFEYNINMEFRELLGGRASIRLKHNGIKDKDHHIFPFWYQGNHLVVTSIEDDDKYELYDIADTLSSTTWLTTNYFDNTMIFLIEDVLKKYDLPYNCEYKLQWKLIEKLSPGTIEIKYNE